MFSGILPLVLSLVLPAANARCDPANALSVLFIGNSYTHVNNVPKQVEEIAASLTGPCVRTEMISMGGATLRAHWEAGRAARRIDEGKWTHVVLQDQSSFGEQWWVDGRFRVGDSSAELSEYGARFIERIKSAGAMPVVIAHWSDDGAPERDQQALDYAFNNFAQATGTAVIPVGTAIKSASFAKPYHGDGHHLSPTGSYMTALMIYASLTNRSPAGAVARIDGPTADFQRGTIYPDSISTLADVPVDVASTLQRLADSIQSRSRANGAVGRPKPLAEEFPQVPHGSRIATRADVIGRWTGSTNVLPAPGGQQLTVELAVSSDADKTADSVYLRVPQMEYAGAVTTSIAGGVAVFTGSIIPRGAFRRSSTPNPFSIEIRMSLQGATLKGIAIVRQPGSALSPSLDAVGRIEVTRM